MTPEQLQELANSLSDLRAAVNQLNGSSSLMANSFNRTIQGLAQIDPNLRRVAQELDQSVSATRQAGNAIQQEQQNAIRSIAANQNATRAAMESLTSASRGMVSALMSTTTSLNNLSGVGKAAAEAINYMGVKMGAASGVAGTVANAFGGLVKVGLEQANAFLQAKNELTKLGAAGQQTTSSLYAYARAAGLHTDTINYMINPMKALGSNIMGLGRGAGDAQKAFMEMLQVSDEQRERFARLGVMQEELISRQGDYVALQTSTGSSIRLQNMTMDQLRKASTDYIRNLYDLSAITGEEVNKLRDKQQAALMERRMMIETLASQKEAMDKIKEAERLEATGRPEDKEEAARLRAEANQTLTELKAQRDLIASLADLPDSLRQGIIQAMTTGGIVGPESETLARMGVLDKILREVSDAKEGGKSAEEAGLAIREILSNAGLENLPGIANALQAGNEELSKAFGYGLDEMAFYSKYADRKLAGPEGEGADARRQRIAAEERGVDAASDLAASLQTVSINLNQLADSLISGPSPLIQNFDLLSESAKAATVALNNMAGERPAGQKLVDDIVSGINAGSRGTQYLDQLAEDPIGFLGNLWDRVTGKTEQMPEPVPQRGGESTLGRESREGRRGTTPTVSTPPPPPVTGTTAPPTAAQAAPTASPSTVPTPSAQSTPLPNYPAVTVETNLGNRITLNAGAVGKIAGQIKEGKNRDQLRGEIKKLIGNNTNYNQATIDKIIDKVAEAANLPKPAGSAATVAPAAATPVTAPVAEPPATAPTTGTAEGTTATPVAAPIVPPATTAVTPEPTRPVERPVDRPATTATPTTPAQRIPADVPAQDFTPSADLKNWIRSQIRRGVRRDAVRKALIDIGYTAQQADIALTAELGNVPTTQPTANVPVTNARPETGRQGNQGRTSAGAQRPQTPAGPAGRTNTPTDFDTSTPNVIDTVSPDQRNWMNRENELRERLSDMVRNKKSITRDQANQILDYYDSIKDKGTIPTVDQIIQNSGALRKPTTTGTRPTGLAESKPEVAPSTQGRVSTPRRDSNRASRPDNQRASATSTNTPQNIDTPSTAPSVTTEPKLQPITLEQLAQTELGRFFRGPQGKGKGKYDTQAPGALLDSRLIDAARKLTETDISPFTLRHITALNDEYHNKLDPSKIRDNTHKQGRAIDFTLDKTPKPEEFSQLEKTLRSIGFSTVKDRYNNTSAVDTGPHIHAEVPKMETGGMISGPKSGYPTMLHGNEIVVPLDPNSILADLGKKSQEQIKTEISTFEKSFSNDSIDPTIFKDIARQNQQLMEMLGYKLDNVINKLDTGNDTQSKILQYSQA